MTTDDEKTLSARKTTTTTTSSIPRADSYQQMKRAMESFNIEESTVRFFSSLNDDDDASTIKFWNSCAGTLIGECFPRWKRDESVEETSRATLSSLRGVAFCLFRPTSCAEFSALYDDETVQRETMMQRTGCFLIECIPSFKKGVFE